MTALTPDNFKYAIRVRHRRSDLERRIDQLKLVPNKQAKTIELLAEWDVVEWVDGYPNKEGSNHTASFLDH